MRWALVWAALATLMRPTAAMTWLPLACLHAWALVRTHPKELARFLVVDVGVIGSGSSRARRP